MDPNSWIHIFLRDEMVESLEDKYILHNILLAANWWFMLVLCPSRTPRFDMKTGLLPIEIYIRKHPTTYANYQPNIFVATQYVQVYEHI